MNHSTPPNLDGADELDEIIHLVGCTVGNLDSASDDYVEKIEECEEEAKAQLQALIDKKCAEARIDWLDELATLQQRNKV